MLEIEKLRKDILHQDRMYRAELAKVIIAALAAGVGLLAAAQWIWPLLKPAATTTTGG